MIILIDTEDKVIEVEKVIDKKDTKKLIRETLRNFDDFEHVVTPPIQIKFIPINKNQNRNGNCCQKPQVFGKFFQFSLFDCKKFYFKNQCCIGRNHIACSLSSVSERGGNC